MENVKQLIILNGNTNMKTNNDYEITAEDIKLAERMHDARQKGLYFETRAVTSLYNRLYHTNLSATSCGSCLRKRIDGIWKKIQELKELTEPKEEIIEQKIEENGEEHKVIGKSGGEDTSKDKKRVKKKSEKV